MATTTRKPIEKTRTYSIRKIAANLLFITIKQTAGRKVSEKTYSVMMSPDTNVPGIRATYAKHEEGREVYTTVYDPETDARHCTFKAGENNKACCHADNLAHLYATRRLPG